MRIDRIACSAARSASVTGLISALRSVAIGRRKRGRISAADASTKRTATMQAEDFFTKPLDLHRLEKRIGELLHFEPKAI